MADTNYMTNREVENVADLSMDNVIQLFAGNSG